MEIIIGAVVVLGLLFLLGVELGTLISVVQMILSALTFLMLLFFLFCVVLLLRSKKREAQLVGLMPRKKHTEDKEKTENGEESKERIKFAHYIVDGEEHTNWFPAEAIMTGKIYADKQCFVRTARLGKRLLIFDRHSVVIVVTGTILMSFCTAGFIVYWLFVTTVL